MKFVPDEKRKEDKPVAYLIESSSQNFLLIRNPYGWHSLNESGGGESIYTSEDKPELMSGESFIKTFFPGDTITITF